MKGNKVDATPLLTKLRGKRKKQQEALERLRNYLKEYEYDIE
jgi:hypothetical protein